MDENINPYTGILEVINKKNKTNQPKYFFIGTVKAGDDEVIQKILIGSIEYESNKNELLRANGLRVETGDRVLGITIDPGQSFIILCKLEEW